MKFLHRSFWGFLCVLVVVLSIVRGSTIQSANAYHGELINGINVSFSAFEKLNDIRTAWMNEFFVDVDGTQQEREKKCAAVCHKHGLSSPGNVCKRATLAPYNPNGPSRCLYDRISYYSIEKRSMAATYEPNPGWTTIYLKNNFCAKEPCKASYSYCEADFNRGNGSCVCTGEFQGKFCDTWDYKKRLIALWSFEDGQDDEISEQNVLTSSGAKIFHAVQRKSNVMNLGPSNTAVLEFGSDTCITTLKKLPMQCTDGFTMMFWVRGLSKAYQGGARKIFSPQSSVSGLYVTLHSVGVKVSFKLYAYTYTCSSVVTPLYKFYQQWNFLAVTYDHESDTLMVVANAESFTCTKGESGKPTAVFPQQFSGSGIHLLLDDIMYIHGYTNVTMIGQYYQATRK